MDLLISGVILWSAAHFLPTLAPGARVALMDKLGRNAYRGIFSLTILLALALIVIGWRATDEVFLYQLPFWTRPIALLLMVFSFVLLGAANYPTRLRLWIRHPQLTGLLLWSISHLMTNGTVRALVLFGGLGAWALFEILLINRRDEAKAPPPVPGWAGELRGLAISAAIFVGVLFLHPYFAGVSPLAR